MSSNENARGGAKQFSEEGWNILRMRWVAIFASIAYPAWEPVYSAFFPEAYDSFFYRVVATIPCWIVAGLSFRRDLSLKTLERTFNVMAYGLTYFVFFLVYMNDLSTGYVLGAYCMFFATGAVLPSSGSLLFYYLSCLAISLWFWTPQNNAIFLLLGILCSGACSTISLTAIHKLLNQLRSSRRQVENVNDSLDNMLNALGQGFLSFDSSGLCKDVCSKATLDLLEVDPAGKRIFDVLKIQEKNPEFYDDFLKFAFEEGGRFDLFAELMPKRFSHSDGKVIALEYRPVVKEGRVREVLVVATDETALEMANRAAESERQHAHMVATIVKEKRSFALFLRQFFRELSAFSTETALRENGEEFLRFLHSAKGVTSVFGILGLASIIHEMEDEWKGRAACSLSLQVRHAEVLKRSMNEFLEAHSYLVGSELSSSRTLEINLEKFLDFMATDEFTRSTDGSKRLLIESTLLPIQSFFVGYADLAVKIALSQGKTLEPIHFTNGELPIYPEAYESLFSSFVHVFRNSVDHGLEDLQTRRELLKPQAGRIRVVFSTELREAKRKWMTIQIRDDGRGIDAQAIRAKLVDQGAGLRDTDVIQKIFDPSFTTRDEVTELSGRGVGLDALKSAALAIGGTVRVETVVGQSTTFTVTVPYIEPNEVLRPQLRTAS